MLSSGLGRHVFTQKRTCFSLKPWHLRVITKLHIIVSLVTDVKGEVQPITDSEDPERSGSMAVSSFNLAVDEVGGQHYDPAAVLPG